VTLLRNLSVARKLALAFGVVLLLIAAQTGVSLWGLSQVAAAGNHINSDITPKVMAGEKLAATVGDMHFSQAEYVADHGGSRKNFLDDAGTYEQAFHTAQSLSTDPNDRAGLQKVAARYAAFRAIDGQVYRDVRAGRQAQAVALVKGRSNDSVDALSSQIEDFVHQLEGDQADSVAAAASTHSSAQTLAIGLAAGALVLCIAIAFVLTRYLTRSVGRVGERLRSLTSNCAASLERGLRAIAQGDLTVDAVPVTTPIEAPGKDELGRLAETFNELLAGMQQSLTSYNATREQLSAMIGEISAGSGTVSAASEEMAATSEEAGRAVGDIASAIGEVAAGATRQVEMLAQARAAAEQTAEAAGQARAVAGEGASASAKATEAMELVRESTARVTEAMSGLARRSDEIGGIVETITGIAGQTNLLALNAAIEAARAGEQGRGFAVVAEEVRQLAEESQQAASSIAGLIAEIQRETQGTVEVVEDGARRSEDGAAVVAEARDAFAQIERAIAEMTERVNEIVATTGEVVEVAERSSATSEQVSASTQQTSATTSEIASSAGDLASTAEKLADLVARFRVG
jgi:methyl-accepting chemotaxis protein